MKEIPTIARPAIIEELTNLTKKGVLTGQHWVDLTPTQRSKILRSHTNVTHKVTPANDGTGRTTDDGRRTRSKLDTRPTETAKIGNTTTQEKRQHHHLQ